MSKEYKVQCVDFQSAYYPPLLKTIKNPPKKLYFIGNIELALKPAVAIVGSRRCSRYGMWAAEKMSKMLSDEEITVVSGMAKGIDLAAHRGAFEGEGKTVAVLGCGIDICFPAGNRELRERIAEKGLLISEYPEGMAGNKWTFPQRNRIISGMSMAVIVAEAGLNSGSLITAEFANEENRTVFAVPGNINSIYSIGANKLIQDGAFPITTFEDVFDVLNIKRKKKVSETEKIGYAEREILDIVLKTGETTVDEICALLNKKVSEVNGIVAVMEIKGLLCTAFGKIFIEK